MPLLHPALDNGDLVEGQVVLDHIGEVYAEEESVDTHAQPGVPEGEHVRHGKQHHGEGKVKTDALDVVPDGGVGLPDEVGK